MPSPIPPKISTGETSFSPKPHRPKSCRTKSTWFQKAPNIRGSQRSTDWKAESLESKEKAEFLIDHYKKVGNDTNLSPCFLSHHETFDSTHCDIINDSTDNPVAFNKPFFMDNSKTHSTRPKPQRKERRRKSTEIRVKKGRIHITDRPFKWKRVIIDPIHLAWRLSFVFTGKRLFPSPLLC
jgi:hypothetical protein